jgi:hypothetical protein
MVRRCVRAKWLVVAIATMSVAYSLRLRHRAAVKARETEAAGVQLSEKRRAVQSGELKLPVRELERMFGGFIPQHLRTVEVRKEMETVCTFDPAEADTWATIPGGSRVQPLVPCRHWDASEQKIDCSIDRPPMGTPARDADNPLHSCSRSTFGGADSPWVKRQVSPAVPWTRHPRITFVSSLIDIGRYSRPRCKYLQYMRPLLRVNVSLVLYLEPWAVSAVTAARAHFGLSAQTEIRTVESWDTVPFYDKLPKMQEAVEKFYSEHARYGWQNGRNEHSYAEYDWINHAKVRSSNV